MKPIAFSVVLLLASSAVAVAQPQKQAKPTTEIVWEAKIKGVAG